MPKIKRKNTFQFRFVENLLKNHRNAFAWLVRWGQGQVHAMVDGLMLVGLLLCLLLPLGVVVSWVGYHINYIREVDTLSYDYSLGDYIIAIGDFIVIVSGLIAAIVYGFQLLRLRLLTAAVVGSNAILQKEIQLASAPLPGDQFDIGQLFTEVQASHIIKVATSVFAAVIGGAVYAAFIPVYTSLILFFGAMLLVAFLAYASAWLEGNYWLPIIKRWSIVAAAVLLLVYLPARFAIAAYAPDFGLAMRSYINIPKAEAKIERAVNDGDNDLRVIAAKKIKALAKERVKLVEKDNFGTSEDISKLQELNDNIAKWQSGKFMTPTPTPNPTPPGVPVGEKVTISSTSSEWVEICSSDCTVSVQGSVDYGGEIATPDSSPRMGDKTAKADGIPFGVLVAKVGKDGKPFHVGSSKTIQSGEKAVYVVVNDSYYADNKGSYTVTK